MGSGLILLVIVGAWLAVLVPMGLRSHDSTTSLSSVDRFSTAMRVLSRRAPSSLDRRSLLVPRRTPAAAPLGRTPAAPAPLPYEEEPVVRAAPSLAVRRRRTLLVLLAGSFVALLGGVVGPGWLLGVGAAGAAVAVLFVVHCRRQAVLKAARAERLARRARAEGRAVAPRRAAPVHVAGIPRRMPPRPAPLTAPLPLPAARYEDLPPAAAVVAARRTEPAAPAAAVGEPWSPVPVPVPTYVTKAKAPVRPPRVLDLTQPGKWTAGLEVEDDLDALGAVADDGELDGILERRRASGGW